MSDQARTIYLVGPITGIADHNAPTFDAAEEQLCAAGYRVVNPLDLHGARHAPHHPGNPHGFHGGFRCQHRALGW